MDKAVLDSPEVSVKDRLIAIAATFAERSELRAFKPLIEKAFAIYVKKLPEEEIVHSLEMVRDELIPWLINGQQPRANTDSPGNGSDPTD